MADTLEFAIRLARKAGELLTDYFRNAIVSTSTKSDESIVTEADFASDRLITSTIQNTFPTALIISEELATVSPAEVAVPERPTWVIDPLDGTTNFCLGMHVWGVLITRLENGMPVETVNFFPLLDELYTARRHQGAWLNGKPIQVQPPRKDYPAAFFSCCSRTYRKYHISVPYKTRILGSAGYSFCCVARGAALVGFEATAKLWDIAGAWLLVAEAGGLVETLDGSHPLPLQPGIDYTNLSYPVLATATTKLMERTRKQIHSLG